MSVDVDLRIVPAEPGDLPELSAIAWRSKAHWGYPSDWLEEWRPQLMLLPEHLESQVVRVARRGVRAAGFYGLALHRLATLEHFWVDPSCMGLGVGRALLDDAREKARRQGYSTLQIDSDPNAEPFYTHMGARRVGWVSAPVCGTARRLPRLSLKVDRREEG